MAERRVAVQIGMTLLGPGALSTALPASALAEPALGHAHIPHHLPWLLAELTPFRRAICLQACPSAPATSALWSRTSRRSSAARWRSVEAPSPLPPLGTTGECAASATGGCEAAARGQEAGMRRPMVVPRPAAPLGTHLGRRGGRPSAPDGADMHTRHIWKFSHFGALPCTVSVSQ